MGTWCAGTCVHRLRHVDNFQMGQQRNTESEKKKTRKERHMYTSDADKQVNIGEEINRWKTLKLTFAFKITQYTL